MKKLLLVALIGLGMNSANADIVIRNKNADPGFSMHVTYRLCKEATTTFTCGAPLQAVIAKQSDFTVNATDTLAIDAAALVNDQTNEVKAQSTYIQYPVLNVDNNIAISLCNIDDLTTPESLPIYSILVLNDRSSPYIVCQRKIKLHKKRENS